MQSTILLTLGRILLAALPILLVLFLMIGRGWGGAQAGTAGWISAVIVSVLFFGATAEMLAVSFGKAVLLALFVLYVIWMALALYHTVNEAGGIAAIGRELPTVAHDRPAQALLLAWIFGSFLQGATGFGVPAAVVAPLLVGLGFSAEIAVIMALTGHAWAVTFGSLGSSFLSLMAATGLPGTFLAGPTAALLGVGCLGCGLVVLLGSGGKAALRQRGIFFLMMALVMAGTQFVVATAGFYTLAALIAGLVGLLAAILWLTQVGKRTHSAETRTLQPRVLLSAFLPYLILIAVVLLGEIPFEPWLNGVVIDVAFPEVCTTQNWCIAAASGRTISVFGHAGALLLYTCLIVFGIYKWRGTTSAEAKPYSGKTILQKTVRGSIKPTIGVLTLVAMALTMEHAAMTQVLADALSATGVFFPLISPFLGALGAFMTGSSTNSNVVFGQLQMNTAETLGLSVALILAAQATGAALGSSFAPAKVVVGNSTVTGSEEGRVLRGVTLAGLAIILVVGLLVWGISAVGAATAG